MKDREGQRCAPEGQRNRTGGKTGGCLTTRSGKENEPRLSFRSPRFKRVHPNRDGEAAQRQQAVHQLRTNQRDGQ